MEFLMTLENHPNKFFNLEFVKSIIELLLVTEGLKGFIPLLLF